MCVCACVCVCVCVRVSVSVGVCVCEEMEVDVVVSHHMANIRPILSLKKKKKETLYQQYHHQHMCIYTIKVCKIIFYLFHIDTYIYIYIYIYIAPPIFIIINVYHIVITWIPHACKY